MLKSLRRCVKVSVDTCFDTSMQSLTLGPTLVWYQSRRSIAGSLGFYPIGTPFPSVPLSILSAFHHITIHPSIHQSTNPSYHHPPIYPPVHQSPLCREPESNPISVFSQFPPPVDPYTYTLVPKS
eukprot:TRINITY_DN6712_c0_g3_i2.p1 TRINITY_DN6712_c0_g3~~TRINITY_DN6712_c0_g3_i2.p1  ORF type:complete len:125 (+),score=4.70 TRINITY_DN6712_c0_g3_i2:1630-2004(+)